MKDILILAAIAIIAVFLSASAGVAAAYMAVKYGAAFGAVLMGFVLGAVLLIDWKGGRNV
jgi:hypothetical protein